jgi:hydroxymethylbilane synthase
MRIGTRSSPLALAQAKLIAQMLGAGELVPMTTAGDRGQSSADKSRWVLELERSLRAGEIDLAVHSAKDVPGELADGLELLGSPRRARPEDVLCGAGTLADLQSGARVGTSSLRRAAQLRSIREDLEVTSITGNVDTRLRKLHEGAFDALVLAGAGLERLGRGEEIDAVLDVDRFVPSPGQGTLALEGRANDEATRRAVQAITDSETFACLLAERSLARSLQASCHTPLGAHARMLDGARLQLRAWVGLPDGSRWIADELEGVAGDPRSLAAALCERLRAVGAGELLAEAEEMAV